MSKDLNLCQFIGRLGADPDTRATNNGSTVASFNMACGDDYKDKQGQKVEQTEWIRVTAFGRLAEIMGQYLHKGSLVYISGKMVTRKWQDQSGADRWTTEINARELQMLDSKPQDQQQPAQPQQAPQQAQPQQQQAPHTQAADTFDQDVPF